MCTRTRGCICSCYTPDDGCKKCPKHVEKSTSEIKVTNQLHRVGLFNTSNTNNTYHILDHSKCHSNRMKMSCEKHQ